MPVSTVTQLFYLVSTQKKKTEIWTSYLRRPERSSCGTLRRNRPLCVLSHLIPSATDKETRTPWVRSLSRSQELIKDLEGPSGLKGPGLLLNPGPAFRSADPSAYDAHSEVF